MILVNKKQSGGIFQPTNLDFGNDNFQALLNNFDSGRSGSSRGGSSSPRNVNVSTTADVKDALPSDLTYYQAQRDALHSHLEQELLKDPDGYDKTDDYKLTTQRLYNLETSKLPTMKTMKSVYTASLDNLQNKEASSSPAILGNQVLVRTAAGYSIISPEELLKDADKYEVVTVGDAATQRMSNPLFNGFENIGMFVDGLLNNVYGDKQYRGLITQQIKNAGFTDKQGVLVDPTGTAVDLNNIEFDSNGTNYRVKTNSNAINQIVSNITQLGESSAKNYARAEAIRELHNKIRNKQISTEKTDIHKLINDNTNAYVLRSLLPGLREEYKSVKQSGSGETSDEELAKQKINMNVIELAMLTQGKQGVEIETTLGDNKSIMQKVPSAVVDRSQQLLEREGFGDIYGRTKKAEELVGQLHIKNNAILNRMADNIEDITTADGVSIASMADRGINGITTAEGSKLHILIAPIEKVGDRERVNFDNKYTNAVVKATKLVEKRLREAGVSDLDLKSYKSNHKIQDVINKVNAEIATTEEFKHLQGVRFGLAVAFDVMYAATGDGKKYTGVTSEATPEAENYLQSRIGGVYRRNIKKARAFLPLSTSFWSNMFADDSLPEEYRRTFTGLDIKLILTNSTTAGMFDAGKTIEDAVEKVETKESGGKMTTSDDIMKLLFE